jgi:predicted amidohydrolase YtcJ
MSIVLYLSGNIYTMDTVKPRAQAMAIDRESGRIIAIGTNDVVRRVGGPRTELVDLHGRTVLPGFIDAHIHLLSTAYRAHHIDAGASTSEDAAVALVRQRAAQTPPGRWIVGGQWDKNLWPSGQFPTKSSLDAAAPDHPVALWSKDGHVLWVNSLALQRAHITANTPQPTTGEIVRDGAGELTGILLEADATKLVYKAIQEADPTQDLTMLERILPQLHRYGITSIHDIEGAKSLHLFQQLRNAKKLNLRVQMLLPRQQLRRWREQEITNDDDDLLRISGIKIFADGTLGSQTAAMLESFEGAPNNYGILATSEEEMQDAISDATEMGLVIAIHAIGDRAAHVSLNAIERARQLLAEEGTPSDPRQGLRYRLEHVQLIAPEDLERMRHLGVIASIQPYHAVIDRDIAEQYWGERHRRAYAYRTMREKGISLALGSDAPVELFDPLRILYAATTRCVPGVQRSPWLPEQSLTIADAVWSYTLGAAYAGAEEHRKGSLSVGKLGDAVVLREDIFSAPPEKIIENGVQATMLGGSIVYGDV